MFFIIFQPRWKFQKHREWVVFLSWHFVLWPFFTAENTKKLNSWMDYVFPAFFHLSTGFASLTLWAIALPSPVVQVPCMLGAGDLGALNLLPSIWGRRHDGSDGLRLMGWCFFCKKILLLIITICSNFYMFSESPKSELSSNLTAVLEWYQKMSNFISSLSGISYFQMYLAHLDNMCIWIHILHLLYEFYGRLNSIVAVVVISI